jgi:hypothetical protein
VGLDLGLCLQGHTKWVGDFSTFVGVYKNGNSGKGVLKSIEFRKEALWRHVDEACKPDRHSKSCRAEIKASSSRYFMWMMVL